MTISQLVGVQFEWNKIKYATKETDYPHHERWWASISAIILNIQSQIV